MTRAVRLVSIGWLVLAAYYVPWTYAIARMAASGTHFTVDPWTLATPFVILGIGSVGALAAWRTRDLVGRVLLLFVASNWLLWATMSAGILHEFLWVPTLLKTILFLCVLTVVIIPLDWLSPQRADRTASANEEHAV